MSLPEALAWASLFVTLVLSGTALYFWRLARDRKLALETIALTLEDIARNASEHDVRMMAAARATLARHYSGTREGTF